jgi:hypothetical protein
MNINPEIISNDINKKQNWKTPGIDKIHDFWIKIFKSARESKSLELIYHKPSEFPEFLIKGVTHLKLKDSDTKNLSKRRSITCSLTNHKITISCFTKNGTV